MNNPTHIIDTTTLTTVQTRLLSTLSLAGVDLNEAVHYAVGKVYTAALDHADALRTIERETEALAHMASNVGNAAANQQVSTSADFLAGHLRRIDEARAEVKACNETVATMTHLLSLMPSNVGQTELRTMLRDAVYNV